MNIFHISGAQLILSSAHLNRFVGSGTSRLNLIDGAKLGDQVVPC